MDEIKKVLNFVFILANTIHEMHEFYTVRKDEIKKIIDPLIEACKDVKQIEIK